MSGRTTAMSYFASPAWEPLAAVGAHNEDGVNAQICVSIFSASIVTDRPRLLAVLWKSNYTHSLVVASGTFAITLLSDKQIDLLDRLGLHSGRDGDKLAGTDFRVTTRGNPYFSRGAGYVDCSVLDALDLGDATAFLCQVEEDQVLSGSKPLSLAEGMQLAGEDFARRYRAKFERDQVESRATMKWA